MWITSEPVLHTRILESCYRDPQELTLHLRLLSVT